MVQNDDLAKSQKRNENMQTKYPTLGRQTQKGFTLIESLTVVTIMAVLMAIAVPNFTLMQANNRVVGTGNELAAMLKQGRSEALVQRRNLQFNAINTSATSMCPQQ